MKFRLTLVIACITPLLSFSQVSVTNSGTPPDSSAMLDIQSTTRGVLIPRMDSVQRQLIANPAEGLLVYDLDTESFWFRQNGQWTELVSGNSGLRDQDNDTRVTVEQSADEDTVRIVAGGNEVIKTGGKTLEVGSEGGSVYIGYGAGLNSADSVSGNLLIGKDAGRHLTTGNNNTFVGQAAGYHSTTGSLATGVGDSVLFWSTTAGRMTALGHAAGMNSNDIFSTFIGYSAGRQATGTRGTYLGYAAGSNDSGTSNTIIGTFAGNSNLSGSFNTIIGKSSASDHTSGDQNTFVGEAAGRFNTSGDFNVFIGQAAGRNNTFQSRNTYIGTQAGFGQASPDSTISTRNTFIGTVAGKNIRLGVRNVMVGDASGYDITDGHRNTMVGTASGTNTTIGERNVMVGDGTGFQNTSGSRNVYVGEDAGNDNATGNNNVFIGQAAGQHMSAGNFNVAVGDSALHNAGDISFAVAIGHRAGFNMSSSQNVIIGNLAGTNALSGFGNTFVGQAAGYHTTTGYSNTFIGQFSGTENMTGITNTFIGGGSGWNNVSGDRNTFIGGNSGVNNTEGERNVYVGYAAASASTSGSRNTILGHTAGFHATGSANVFLGYQAGYHETDSVGGKMYIANDSTEYPLIYGDFEEEYLVSNGSLLVNGVDSLLEPPRSLLAIAGPDATTTGPILTFYGESSDQFESGRLRFREGLALNNYRGGFIHYDGASNLLHLGVHDASDNDPLNDFNAISIERTSGQVGIGTTSPDTDLHVVGADNDGTVATLKVTSGIQSMLIDGNEIDAITSDLLLQNNTADDVILALGGGKVGIGTLSPDRDLTVFDTEGNGGAVINVKDASRELFLGVNSSGVSLRSLSNDEVSFWTNNVRHMTIGTDGNVGIGTSNPEHPLHIQKNGIADQQTITMVLESAVSDRPVLLFSENGSSLDLNDGMSIEYDGSVSGNELNINVVGGTPALTVESSSGEVGIGTTNPTALLEVFSNTVKKIGGGSWAASSDIRLKQDINDFLPGLEDILRIRPVNFRYNELSGYDTTQEHVGVIAQEIEKIAPYMISSFEKDGSEYLEVDNSAMVYMLINAVRQLAEQNDVLRSRVDVLEGLNNDNDTHRTE